MFFYIRGCAKKINNKNMFPYTTKLFVLCIFSPSLTTKTHFCCVFVNIIKGYFWTNKIQSTHRVIIVNLDVNIVILFWASIGSTNMGQFHLMLRQ